MIGKSRKLRKINCVRLNVSFQGQTLLLETNVLKATLYLFYFQANIGRFEKNADIWFAFDSGFKNFQSEFKCIFTIKKDRGEENLDFLTSIFLVKYLFF